MTSEWRTLSREAAINEAFKAAWMECIEKHEATMVSGPCDVCCEKHARLLREAPHA